MKSKIYLLLMVFLCSNVNVSLAQKKVDKALDNFLRSEFMLKFQDMRTDAERTVLSFKAQQSEYSERDVGRVSRGYNATVTKFNGILRGISDDLANSKKARPDYYENLKYKLKYETRELQDFYAIHFVQVIRDVKGNYEEDGSPLIAAFPLLAQAFSEIIAQMSELRKQKRTLSRELVERKLYRSNRFRTWDEVRIEGATGAGSHDSDYPAPNGGYPNSDEPQSYPPDYPPNNQEDNDQNDGYPDTDFPQEDSSDYPEETQDEDYPDPNDEDVKNIEQDKYPANRSDNYRLNKIKKTYKSKDQNKPQRKNKTTNRKQTNKQVIKNKNKKTALSSSSGKLKRRIQ